MSKENQDIIKEVKKYFDTLEKVKSMPEYIRINFSSKYTNLLAETFIIGKIEEWNPEGHPSGWILHPQDDEVYTYWNTVFNGQVELISPEDIGLKLDKERFLLPDFKIGDIALIFRDIKTQTRLNISILRPQ